jgi:mRNA-degrading endonuclease RelE of RelBE toxin-antitoxin system
MNWTVKIEQNARKPLKKFPAKDRDRILKAFGDFEKNPFTGDVVPLYAGLAGYRRRVGNYRIFFDVHAETASVEILKVERRTSKTY